MKRVNRGCVLLWIDEIKKWMQENGKKKFFFYELPKELQCKSEFQKAITREFIKKEKFVHKNDSMRTLWIIDI